MTARPHNASAPPTQPIGADAFAVTPTTALWWLGGAGFLINTRGTIIAIDPAIALAPGTPATSELGLRLLVPLPIEAAAIPRLDLLLYTHTDPDHYAPATARELLRTGATIVSSQPVAARLRELGVAAERLQVIVAGQRRRFGEVEIEATRADHAWQRLDPARYGPPFGPDDCLGFIVRTPDGTIWHPGDTVLLEEHRRVAGIDVLLLDISRGDWHLGPVDAAALADAIGAPQIVPHHYGCYDAPDFGAVNGDPAEVAALLTDAARRLRVLAPGEQLPVTGRRRAQH